MPSLSDDALAAELAAVREARLAKIEADLKALKPRQKDLWEKLQVLIPLASAVLVAVVGYFLTGSVNNAIQRQQLQLSNVKEMRDLLVQITSSDQAQAEAAAFTLAAFGRPAAPPLMAALVAGGEVRGPAAETALRAIGLNDPDAVCGPARRIVDNRTGRFSWLAHIAAMRLLGDLDCREALPSVEAYARALADDSSDLERFARHFSSEPPPDGDAAQQLKDQTEQTLRMLRR